MKVVKRYKLLVIRIDKTLKCKVQYGDCNSPYCIVYLKVAKRGNLKSSHHKEKRVTV